MDPYHTHVLHLIVFTGTGRLAVAEFHDVEDAKRIFDTNFFGMMDLNQLTLPLLRESHGRVIMVSSLVGLVGNPKGSVYSASKFAMEGFSDSLRREVKHFDISVSVIEPAVVNTEFHQKVQSASPYNEHNVEKAVGLYPMFHDATYKQKRHQQLTKGSNCSVATDAIVHAITSRTPNTRYTVANINGTPATFIAYSIGSFSRCYF